jgi:hypothetical protein
MRLARHESLKEELAGLCTEADQMHKLLEKKEEGDRAMSNSDYAVAVKVFDETMKLPRSEEITELTEIRLKAKEMQDLWEKMKEGEKAMADGEHATAVVVFEDAIQLLRHEKFTSHFLENLTNLSKKAREMRDKVNTSDRIDTNSSGSNNGLPDGLNGRYNSRSEAVTALEAFLLTTEQQDCHGRRMRCRHADAKTLRVDNSICKKCTGAECRFKIKVHKPPDKTYWEVNAGDSCLDHCLGCDSEPR